MRMLRLALSATITVLLLTSTAVPAVGQGAADAEVTGTVACWTAGSPTELENGALRFKLEHDRCTAEMSDPRVSGTMDSDIQQVCLEEAGPRVCVQHGTVELEGPEGTWVGAWDAMNSASFCQPTWMVMEGTGAYDGWTYWLFISDQYDPTSEATGILYKGPPPPWHDSLPLKRAD